MTETPTRFERWITDHRADPDFVLAQAVMDITAEIQSELERQGISRSELARRLGVDRAQVSRILNGHPNLTVKSLVRVALALGLKLDMRLAGTYDLLAAKASPSAAADLGGASFVSERRR